MSAWTPEQHSLFWGHVYNKFELFKKDINVLNIEYINVNKIK